MDSKEIIRYWESKYSSEEVVKGNFNLEPFLHGLLSAFSPGHSFHYIVNFKSLQLKFVSESVFDFVGVKAERVTMEEILSIAEKDQIDLIKLKEQVTYDFYFNFLPSDEVIHYKLVYLYRMKDPDGKSRVMLHQALPLSLDEQGNLENALSVHTDISYLKIQPGNSISFFSLTGKESFINLSTLEGKFDPLAVSNSGLLEALTPREKEIVELLSKGFSSKEISERLNVSVHTIQKHRKNILRKTNCSNTSELVSKCIMEGLVM